MAWLGTHLDPSLCPVLASLLLAISSLSCPNPVTASESNRNHGDQRGVGQGLGASDSHEISLLGVICQLFPQLILCICCNWLERAPLSHMKGACLTIWKVGVSESHSPCCC